ncbi:MAG TPA: LysR family transcriptional regulator [Acidovorax defluvii]|jgi:DNA-binding transcriptional LysR family regulator|uniref:LysR family transcriptional regulator n=1 Tax=unclassified Acidovorax TaxID=2684926 RepID=UPI000464B8E2|nr:MULTISPECIES: LysR family transcriptional regulator [unclassified Acidovorax]MCL5742010.1 LysR family transcriptional regulator [Betaproteobacteria bacterium]RDD91719.1 LysR family transcriptional regulator [Acidovorax sp. BoFeN1]HRG05267.1 LysR family transcriptional regulator [Acidovorax defluvii]
MDWDNLRYFLELARAGTLVGAARRLAVDHTTVARRLQALEKQVGAALFAREAGGHRLTEAGRALLPQVEAMEAAFLAVENAAPGVRQGLHGLVRIGTTEGFGNLILAPQLARFALSHPGLVVDLLALPRLVHLSRREADIVISLERPARGAVLVVKLTDYVLQLYGARSYLERYAPICTADDLRGHTFISYVDDLLFSKELQILDELHRPAHFALRSTSILAQYEAARAGAGLAVLPAFVAAQDPALIPVLPGVARFQRTFWMSMPGDNKHVARMQATWAFLREAVAAKQGLLLPQINTI